MIETDALVVGAGPAGLFAVFQLGLHGISCHVVDALDEPGGQCIELYPDKPLYDIPGQPHSTGRELTRNLLKQIQPFAPQFHFAQLVSHVALQTDGRWLVSTSVNNQSNQQFLTHTIFIAAGVGAFMPKELKVQGLDYFFGRQLFYRHTMMPDCHDKSVVVVGGEEAALAAAISLAQAGPLQARSVTLLYRRDVLQASAETLSTFDELRSTGRIQFQAGQVTAVCTEADRLSGVSVQTAEDKTLTLPLDALLVCQGISPKLGPLTQWGLAMERKQLTVDTATFETSEPGIFAIGDIVTYPGKKKLIVCGFHEATLAAFAAAARIRPQESSILLYTSSSALLQQRLGINASK